METPAAHEDGVPGVPRRDEPVPPPWFERPKTDVPPEPDEPGRSLRFSWLRAIGLLTLVLVIVGIPLDFAVNYFSTDSAWGRTNMTLGFVWAVVIEALAVWVLIRLLSRR